MNKPIAAKPAPDFPRVSTPDRSSAGRLMADPAPRRKPTGPVIYQIEKGADVWPIRNA
jgi:hypothetical protein